MATASLGKYDYFLDFVNEHITATDLRGMKRRWENDKYKRDPQLMLTELDEFFIDKYQDNAKIEGTKRDDTREANFKKAIKTLIDKRQTQVVNPYDQNLPAKDRRIIDFQDEFGQYLQYKDELLRPAKIRRVEKAAEALEKFKKPEIGERIETSTKVFARKQMNLVKQMETRLESAKEAKDTQRLLAYRENLERLEDGLKGGGPELLPVYKEVRRIIDKDRRDMGETIKVRTGRIGKDALIDDIQELSRRPREDLESMSTKSLKSAWNDLYAFKKKEKYVLPKKDVIRGIPQIRTEKEAVLDASGQKIGEREVSRALTRLEEDSFVDRQIKGMTKFYADRGLELTREDRANVRRDILEKRPHLSGRNYNIAVAQELASRAYEKDPTVMIPEKEIERRLMFWKYKDSTKTPDAQDMIEFSKLGVGKIGRITHRIGPGPMRDGSLSGPYQEGLDIIPKTSVSSYASRLKKESGPIRAAVTRKIGAAASIDDLNKVAEREAKDVEKEFGFR